MGLDFKVLVRVPGWDQLVEFFLGDGDGAGPSPGPSPRDVLHAAD